VRAAGSGDPLLDGFLAALNDEEARERLGELLAGEASPLLWRIFRRQLGRRDSGFAPAELEDLHATTLLKLQLQLVAARAGEREPPASFLDYVAAAGFNAVAGLLMARQPERTRLRDRLRYVLRRDSGLAAWSGADREPLCGRARHRGDPAAVDVAALAEPVGRAHARHGAGWGEFSSLVAQVLRELPGPCRLEDLVDTLAGELGLQEALEVPADSRDTAAGSRSDGERPAAAPPLAAGGPSVLERLELEEAVGRLWEEIAELPPNQRVALLLSLRGTGGESLVDVLVATGVVEPAGLAGALGMTVDELDRLLPGLPLDDLAIGARLGLARQQVINLRKSARLRLARRLRGELPPVAASGPGLGRRMG